MKKTKGSITIFSLLSLLLISASLFALLEGTRLQELRRVAKLQTETAIESVFARYNTCLWERYHLLATENGMLSQQLFLYGNGKVSGETSLLQLTAEEIKIENYTCLTDAGGKVFIQSIASYMSDNWIYETAKEIYNLYEAMEYLLESSSIDRGDIETAIQEIEEAQTEKTTRKLEKKSEAKALLEIAKSWMENGILELLIQDTKGLSKEEIDFQDSLLNRVLEKGTQDDEIEIGWKEKILLQQYLITYLSHYQEEKQGRALSYEIEYLIGAKTSDIENLTEVAIRLLSIREAANCLYLISSPEKMAQVESIALLIGGVSLNPVLYEVVKAGILATWALAESILDVRALLAGERIPLLKSDENWTSELEHLNEITNGYPKAITSTWGLNYEDYLRVLLLMQTQQKVAMRAMNIQEATVRDVYSDSSFRMDALIVDAEATITYSYRPIFPFLEVIHAEERWEYRIMGTKKYGYY